MMSQLPGPYMPFQAVPSHIHKRTIATQRGMNRQSETRSCSLSALLYDAEPIRDAISILTPASMQLTNGKIMSAQSVVSKYC